MRQDPRFLRRWGVTFADADGERWHSYRDFGLLPAAPPDFGTPTVKTNLVDIPGMNGALDLTESFGFIPYGPRPGSFAYYLPSRREADQKALHARLAAALHGRRLRVIADENATGYYEGRLSVGPIVQASGSRATVTITADLDPFRIDIPERIPDDPLWRALLAPHITLPMQTAEITGYHNTVTILSSPLGGTPRVKNNGEEAMLLTADTASGSTEYQIPAGEWITLTGVELPRNFEEVAWDVSCPGSSGTITIAYETGRI